jgi:hypothetical protein
MPVLFGVKYERMLAGRPSAPKVSSRPSSATVRPRTTSGVYGATTLSSAASWLLSQRSRVRLAGSSSPRSATRSSVTSSVTAMRRGAAPRASRVIVPS